MSDEKNHIEKLLGFGVTYSRIYFTCRLIQNKQAEHYTAFVEDIENGIECLFEEVQEMAKQDRFDLKRFDILLEKLKQHQNECNKHVVALQIFGECIFH